MLKMSVLNIKGEHTKEKDINNTIDKTIKEKVFKFIRVKKPTWKKLNMLKEQGKTFDTIINELLEKET